MALDKFQPYLFVSAGEQSNKYLTPGISSGGIAYFQAQRAQDLSGLTIRIDPVQEGTGDPSPDNIRPITGRTSANIIVAGKNLCPTQTIVKSGNSYYIGGVYNYIPFRAGTYTLTNAGTAAYAYYEKEGAVNNVIIHTGLTTVGTFTLEKDCNIRIWFYTGTADPEFTDIQIDYGAFATPYEPYKGTTYSISWQTEAGTIYGGTLDVVSGVLTVTHGYILLDGTQSFRTNGRTAITQRAFISIDGKAVGTANMQSDRFFVTSSGDVVGKMNGRAASNGVEFYLPLDGTADTDASCKQWFADNNTQLAYELATPQTYQLTGAEVRTIAGYNQVYSDAGPVIDIKF